MAHLLGKFFLNKSDVLPANQFEPERILRNPSVYEVLRFIDRVPLFAEDHYERFYQSCRIKNISHPVSYNEFNDCLQQLLEINEVTFGNIKMVFNISGYEITDSWYYLDQYSYPEPEEYRIGVVVQSLNYQRIDPEVKIINPELRSLYEQNTGKQDVNELILVDFRGFITEGSRSNIFFIDGHEILTPPPDKVLQGVTRKKVFEICDQNQQKISEKPITIKEAGNFSAMFITGTSRKILPVRKFDQYIYRVDDPLLRDLIRYYDQMLLNYISNYKSFV